MLLSGGLLALVLLVTGIGTAFLGNHWAGTEGIVVALASALLCFFAAALGLLSVYIFQMLGQALNGLLLSILFRTGLPLAGGVVLLEQVTDLTRRETVILLTVNYLAALTSETILSVLIVGKNSTFVSKSAGKKTTDNGTSSDTLAAAPATASSTSGSTHSTSAS